MTVKVDLALLNTDWCVGLSGCMEVSGFAMLVLRLQKPRARDENSLKNSW